ncbi:MAG: ferrochelatase [Chloroflexales bacterium]|nr:ferrochelatase [Chloroflexales bacterium]
MSEAPIPTPIGVLLMEYGEPATLDDVEPFLSLHYGGRTPPPESVDYLRERCRRVWGGERGNSPVPAMRSALAEELARRAGERYCVMAGARYWHPYVDDVLPQLAMSCQEILVLPLSPHASHMGLRDYHHALDRSLARCATPPHLTLIEQWADLPGLLATVAANTQAALERFPAAQRNEVSAVFCAHSVAESARKPETAYREQLEASSAAVAAMAGLQSWRLAFYSAEGPGQWLGPDVVDCLDLLHAEGVSAALYVPFGVYDNVELRYEMDVRVAERAAELGIMFQYAAQPNAASALIAGLADVVIAHDPVQRQERVR